ncbi:MAG TPA: cysteine desulfurase family protein [Clostridia bacterium]|nr:cysteine desulfurase family protein [Clostridia bacterium]
MYFDNAATTRILAEASECINDINNKIYGNSSSMHIMGLEAEKVIDNSRRIIAITLGSTADEVYFTSGGTESNNTAIFGYLKANLRNGNHIITTEIEHPSVYETFEFLKSQGYRVDYVPVNTNGECDIEFIQENICDDTTLISIMHTNNEVGAIQDVKRISELVKSKKASIAMHVDFIQGYCKIPLQVKTAGIDLLSVSGHKIHGPKGIGALYVKKSLKVSPIMYGGGQENGLRSGTENTSSIAGFGVAANIMFSDIDANYKKVKDLNRYFRSQIDRIGFENKILSPDEGSPYILNIAFKNVKAEVLLHHLEQCNIYVSSGSACFSKKRKQSRILTAIGIPKEIADGAVRFSFSTENTLAEVDEAIIRLKEILPVISYTTRRKR